MHDRTLRLEMAFKGKKESLWLGVKRVIFQLLLNRDHGLFLSKITGVIPSIHILLEKMLLHLLVRNCIGFTGSSVTSFGYKGMTKF